jgi:hypothetical protein
VLRMFLPLQHHAIPAAIRTIGHVTQNRRGS